MSLLRQDCGGQGNEHHQWRIRPVPSVLAICCMCRVERVCTAFDHDLRGHLCDEDAAQVRNAEDALATAGITYRTCRSILDQPSPGYGSTGNPA